AGARGDRVDPARDRIELSEIVLGEVQAVHGAAVLGQQVADRPADALLVAGDDRGFPFESGHRRDHGRKISSDARATARARRRPGGSRSGRKAGRALQPRGRSWTSWSIGRSSQTSEKYGTVEISVAFEPVI